MSGVRDRKYFDKLKYPNVYRGHNYALDTVEGLIPNSKYIIGSCKRYLSDLEKGKYPFDADKAEKFLRLAQKFNHIKGEWETSNIVYEPWQCWIFMNIYGFVDPRTGYRRFRVAYIEVARGNGKSAIASTACLYMLALDNPKGNEISTFATTSNQARIVLDSSRAMARGNPGYLNSTGVEVLAHTIKHDKSNSIMRARSSDHGSLDGLNDILSVIDELHAVDRALYDVVTSGMKKRRDSLLLCITTAGFNTDGVGHDQSVFGKKVALGEFEDDQLFSAIYTIDDGDDIFEENTWKKANPNYAISVDPVTFEAMANKSRSVPSELANFKVKHLNIWVSEARAFYDLNKWDQCADPSLKIEDFKGEKCNLGIDISSKIDLTSIASVFKKGDIYYIFDKSYIPEATALEINNTLYNNCIGNGHLIMTKGEAIQLSEIKKDILTLTKQHKVMECMFDPWNSIELSQQLLAERVNMIEFRMSTANLSEPTKTLDSLMRQKKIRHNGSPLLRWAVGNIVCKEDAAGNVFPRKSADRLKIDPVIAILMALAGLLQKEQKDSVYEKRGLRVM